MQLTRVLVVLTRAAYLAVRLDVRYVADLSVYIPHEIDYVCHSL